MTVVHSSEYPAGNRPTTEAAQAALTGDQALQAFQNGLESRLVGFDPAFIITILDTVMTLLKSCMTPTAAVTPQTLRQACTQRGPLVRMRVRQALRSHGIHPLTADGQRAMEAVFDTGQHAQDNELQALIEKVI